MHWIQRHVLRQLIQNSSLHYAQIKPDDIEGSLFMYHLRILIRDGLVQKTPKNLYELTLSGRLQADKLQLKTLSLHEQPRVIVLVACWDDKKGLLLFRRRTHPVINMIGFPHINSRMGATLVKSAEEEFRALSNLRVSLKRRGEGYITLFRGNEPESYVFLHLLEGRNPTGTLKPVTETGELEWYQDLKFDDPAFLPSMGELVKLLQQSQEQTFFTELTYTL